MNSLLLYIIKVLICSGVLFFYYWFVLRNKKFHQYNRFYLLFSVAFSLLIPLSRFTWFKVEESTVNNFSLARALYEGDLEPVVVTMRTISWTTILAYTIIAISLILLLLLSVRVWNVFRLTKKYPKVKWDGVDFLDTDIASAPFSFLNFLFWKNNIDVQSQVGQQILEHELTHIRQKHTWDKLFMQIVSSIMWFNPFYWIMQRELLMIHEFLADEKAVGDQDVQSFAAMLLEAYFGKKILSPIHPFAYRPIHRRLKMLTSSSKPKYSYMRRLFFLPLLIVVTGLFAFTVQKQDWKVAAVDLKTWAKNVGIDILSYDSSNMENANSTDSSALGATKKLPDSLIVIRDNKSRDTIANVSTTKLRLIESKNVNTTDTGKSLGLVVRGSRLETGRSKPLIVIDGIPANQDINTLNPNNIHSMTVLKDKSAEAIYGEKAKDGVILIATKTGLKGSSASSDTTKKATIYKFTPVQKNNSNQDKLNEVVVVGYGKDQDVDDNQQEDQEPTFPGGTEAWRVFLMRHLRADVPISNKAPSGRNYTVLVSFIVGKDGTLSMIKAENNPGYGTAEEAVRVIGTSGKWNPATRNGKAVVYRQRQQITFQVIKDTPKKK